MLVTQRKVWHSRRACNVCPEAEFRFYEVVKVRLIATHGGYDAIKIRRCI